MSLFERAIQRAARDSFLVARRPLKRRNSLIRKGFGGRLNNRALLQSSAGFEVLLQNTTRVYSLKSAYALAKSPVQLQWGFSSKCTTFCPPNGRSNRSFPSNDGFRQSLPTVPPASRRKYIIAVKRSVDSSKTRAVHRLVTEVVCLGGDAAAWTDCLLEGARNIFGAKMAACALCPLPNGPGELVRADVSLQRGLSPEEVRHWNEGYWGEGNTYRSELLRRCGMIRARFITVRRRDLMSDEEWYRSEAFQQIHQILGVDDQLVSMLVVLQQRRIFGLAVHKPIGTKPYTVADRRHFRLLHVELARAWQGSIVAPVTDDAYVERLPPRLREVLWMLCAGRSEKEVAVELALSPRTIHNHVVRLHSHFGVHSRGELLARVLNRSKSSPNVQLPDESMNQYSRPDGG